MPFPGAFSFRHLELFFLGDSLAWITPVPRHLYLLLQVIAFSDPVAQASHPPTSTPVAKNMLFPEAFAI